MTCDKCGGPIYIGYTHVCSWNAANTTNWNDSVGPIFGLSGKVARSFDQALQALERGCTVYMKLPGEK